MLRRKSRNNDKFVYILWDMIESYNFNFGFFDDHKLGFINQIEFLNKPLHFLDTTSICLWIFFQLLDNYFYRLPFKFFGIIFHVYQLVSVLLPFHNRMISVFNAILRSSPLKILL